VRKNVVVQEMRVVMLFSQSVGEVAKASYNQEVACTPPKGCDEGSQNTTIIWGKRFRLKLWAPVHV
jgi:hypothetical protein